MRFLELGRVLMFCSSFPRSNGILMWPLPVEPRSVASVEADSAPQVQAVVHWGHPSGHGLLGSYIAYIEGWLSHLWFHSTVICPVDRAFLPHSSWLEQAVPARAAFDTCTSFCVLLQEVGVRAGWVGPGPCFLSDAPSPPVPSPARGLLGVVVS
jgi:hypothetical protein